MYPLSAVGYASCAGMVGLLGTTTAEGLFPFVDSRDDAIVLCQVPVEIIGEPVPRLGGL